MFKLPSDYDGDIFIEFIDPWYWTLAFIVSFLCAFILFFWGVYILISKKNPITWTLENNREVLCKGNAWTMFLVYPLNMSEVGYYLDQNIKKWKVISEKKVGWIKNEHFKCKFKTIPYNLSVYYQDASFIYNIWHYDNSVSI